MKEFLNNMKTETLEVENPEEDTEGVEEAVIEARKILRTNKEEESFRNLQGKIAESKELDSFKVEKTRGELKKIEGEEEMTPEQIQDKIKEYQQRVKDWESFTIRKVSDSGLGDLGQISINENPLASRYPGLTEVYGQLDRVKKSNATGWKFWKNPEIDDVTAQAFKNKLITGSFGRFVGPNGQKMEAEIAKRFEEFVKSGQENVESGDPAAANEKLLSVRDAILGDKDVNSYKKEIEELTAKLNQKKIAA